MFSGSGGSKNRLAKAAGAELCGGMRDQKLHAAEARSTIRSQNVNSTWTQTDRQKNRQREREIYIERWRERERERE